MKRAFLIHGWGGSPSHGFFPWLKEELESRGYLVAVPFMPNSDRPTYETWVPFLESLIGTPDEETLLIGHSMGCKAALCAAERLPKGGRIGMIVMVAPVIDRIDGMEEADVDTVRPLLARVLDAEVIRGSTTRLIGIFSDDDPYIPLDNETYCRISLGAETMILHGRRHFSGDDGCIKLPELLKFI